MGNRRSASMVVPPRRQIQCATLNLEDKNVSCRRNLADWMQRIASAMRWTIWTTAALRLRARAEGRAELRGKVRTKVRGNPVCAETGLLAVLKFFVPGHLDGLELSFVRQFRVACESWKLDNPFIHIGEAYRQRVDAGMFFRQLDADFLGVVPIKRVRHSSPLLDAKSRPAASCGCGVARANF